MRENNFFYSFIFCAMILFLSIACQTTEKTATNKAAPTANTATVNSRIKTASGRGKVTKINLELVSVELDHEEIPGIMPPMIMEFYVDKKSELEVLKVGDTVDFVLEDNAGAEKIISIKKSE